MTERKNVTLKAPYDQMFRDLKARGEFDRAFGSFSEFVQAMIEDFHDDPDRVRSEYHKNREERHRQLRETFEEQSDTSLEEHRQELEEKEEEFFEDFYSLLKDKAGTKEWYDDKMDVYKTAENGWIRKYQKQFASIHQKEFRQKIQEYIGKERLEELGLVGKVEG